MVEVVSSKKLARRSVWTIGIVDPSVVGDMEFTRLPFFEGIKIRGFALTERKAAAGLPHSTKPGIYFGSSMVRIWLAGTSFRICLAPLGQWISISLILEFFPRPKWTRESLE